MNYQHERFKSAAPKAKEFLDRHPLVDKLSSACAASGWKATIIGGFPRDLLFGRNPNDVDIVVEGCPDIDSLKGAVNGLGFGIAKEKGGFDRHFDLPCNGTPFSIFRAEGTYGGVGKTRATVEDVVSAFDYNINTFAISLPDGQFIDTLGLAKATFDEGLLFILPTNRTPVINNRARTILRGIRFAAQMYGLEVDELSHLWMEMNSGHLRKISPEDFDKIIGGLKGDEKEAAIREYHRVLSFEFIKEVPHIRILPEDATFHSSMRWFVTHPPKYWSGVLDPMFRLVPFDNGQNYEQLDTTDIYFDTDSGKLSKAGILFRMSVRRRHPGSEPAIDVSLRSGRSVDHKGIVRTIDDYAKLTKEQREEILKSEDPLQFDSLEPVKTLKAIASKMRISPNEIKGRFRIQSQNHILVFQNYSVPHYTPFIDNEINVDIAPNLGPQVELRFSTAKGNGKTVNAIEVSSPQKVFGPDFSSVAKYFPGEKTDKTKLELIYGNRVPIRRDDADGPGY